MSISKVREVNQSRRKGEKKKGNMKREERRKRRIIYTAYKKLRKYVVNRIMKPIVFVVNDVL